MNLEDPTVHLTGQLICRTTEEIATVVRHLPTHVELTRAEPGCVSFEITPAQEPGVWEVDERFVDQAAFDDHQRRVAVSEWGRATAGIERQYTIT